MSIDRISSLIAAAASTVVDNVISTLSTDLTVKIDQDIVTCFVICDSIGVVALVAPGY